MKLICHATLTRGLRGLVVGVCLSATSAFPFSVQTHEAIIDLAWKGSIQPALLQRFPGMTLAQLDEAHAYAYGGCAIQDFGYYPRGNPFASDLAHYVRSGDFVRFLLQDARTPDEYAFAIGALSHYIGDVIGHGEAVNLAVGVEFPRLAAQYGRVVSYADGKHQHVQTEFAFDVDQLSKGHFAPDRYLRHIGLRVSTTLIARVFLETYGFPLQDLTGGHVRALRIYTFGVRSLLPGVARAETLLPHHFPPEVRNEESDALLADFAQATADNEWAKYARPPGLRSHLLAGVILVLPKVGPLALLKIKGPTTGTEALYVTAVNHTIKRLRFVLSNLNKVDALLPNRDLDTGGIVKPGGYPLTDVTYARLVKVLTSDPNRVLPRGLKENILEYYADPSSPICTKKNPKEWAATQKGLMALSSMTATVDRGLADGEPEP